jgi:hypothetical protein
MKIRPYFHLRNHIVTAWSPLLQRTAHPAASEWQSTHPRWIGTGHPRTNPSPMA